MATGDDNAVDAADGGADSDSSSPCSQPPKPSRTQSRLGATFLKAGPSSSSSSSAKPTTAKRTKLEPGTARATLVVAPMTLLSQWCDELERSSKGKKMRVLMYYGNKRESGAELAREIDEGVDVVVTRCVLSALTRFFFAFARRGQALTMEGLGEQLRHAVL